MELTKDILTDCEDDEDALPLQGILSLYSLQHICINGIICLVDHPTPSLNTPRSSSTETDNPLVILRQLKAHITIYLKSILFLIATI